MDIWKILGIENTNDINIIKKAYAARSKEVHPEEHPKEFRMLHDAYKMALKLAKQQSNCMQRQDSCDTILINDDKIKEEAVLFISSEIDSTKSDNNISSEVHSSNQEEYFDFENIIETAQQQEENEIRAKTISIIEKLEKMDGNDITGHIKSKWIDFMCSLEFQELTPNPYFAKKITNFFKYNTLLTKAQLCGIKEAFAPEGVKSIQERQMYSELYSTYFSNIEIKERVKQNNKKPKNVIKFAAYLLIEIAMIVYNFTYNQLISEKMLGLFFIFSTIALIIYTFNICKNIFSGLIVNIAMFITSFYYVFKMNAEDDNGVWQLFAVIALLSSLVCLYKILKKYDRIKNLKYKREASDNSIKIEQHKFDYKNNFIQNLDFENEEYDQSYENKNSPYDTIGIENDDTELEKIYLDSSELKEKVSKIINQLDSLNKKEFKRNKLSEWEEITNSKDFYEVKEYKYFKRILGEFIVKNPNLHSSALLVLKNNFKNEVLCNKNDEIYYGVYKIYNNFDYNNYLKYAKTKNINTFLIVSFVSLIGLLMVTSDITIMTKILCEGIVLLTNVLTYYVFKICSFYKRGIFLSALFFIPNFIILLLCSDSPEDLIVAALGACVLSTFTFIYAFIKSIKDKQNINNIKKILYDV